LGDSTPQARVPESDADVRDRFVVIAQHYCTLAKLKNVAPSKRQPGAHQQMGC
jgi:hypothetical protein